MNKDVIYIDVDDDVTAIIGKIKSAKEKIVAIVPPKRAGALQSAVNLRLLDRMAKTSKKQLVLITNNQALVALAANSSIPVAKNLQSKPEIAEVPALAVDDGDDIIDGGELPIGDHAKTADMDDSLLPSKVGRDAAVDGVNVDDEDNTPIILGASGVAATAGKASGKARPKVAIPNFDRFRKRLFLGIGGGVLLIALLVWMFAFAPAATIVVTAVTNPAPVSTTVELGGNKATDFEKGIIKSVSEKLEEDETIEFDATGQRDVGEKATGTVTFSTDNISALGTTIPEGTELTASGETFSTDTSVTMNLDNYTGAEVGITATERGTASNGVSGGASGAPSNISASITETTSGGTTKVVKVVSSADIERARGDLIGRSTDKKKAELIALFTDGEKVIDSSFEIDREKQTVSPAVGNEASDGKATLTIPTTYSVHAIPQAELEAFLNSSLQQQLASPESQRVYDTGASEAGLSNFREDDGKKTATVTATGRIGPQIDDAAIKEQVKGKIYGEVQSSLEAIEGIREVDVQFSYFWVRSVPNNVDKIQIEFKLEDE
jgi:hypothetical protein